MITKQDLQNVLKTMQFYNRTAGYIAVINGKLTFFDSEPSEGGAYITDNDLKQYIKNY